MTLHLVVFYQWLCRVAILITVMYIKILEEVFEFLSNHIKVMNETIL